MPVKYSVLKEMLKDLGLKVEHVDVCENNCIFYRKEYEYATKCPYCKSPRYKVKSRKDGRKESKELNNV